MYEYKCRIDRVIDGDTVDCWVDLGFSIWTFERIRVCGIDTPEIRGTQKPQGLISKARVEELLPVDSEAVLCTFKDERGKFGRILGDFEVLENRKLSEVLLEEGLAKPYHGGTR